MTLMRSALAAGMRRMIVAAVSCRVAAVNPGADIWRVQGMMHGMVSLPSGAVWPRSLPAESATAAEGIAEPRLSSTVRAREDWAIRLADARGIRASASVRAARARAPAISLNLNHCIAVAFGVGEQAVE